MYDEQKKGFSVRDILIQILFIILFIFILVWLFPTKASLEGQFDNVNKKLDLLTGTIYNTNIQTMKEAAISYYTNERLPKALNDVERITLGNMLDKKLLVDFVDGNGKSCDNNASYVEVVKLEDEFQMKINLSCSDNDAYIIVHLGCYDYCEASGVCEKKTPAAAPTVTPNTTPTPRPVVNKVTCSYEYKRVIDGKWGEYGNWSSWSTAIATQTDYRKVEMKTEKILTGTSQVQTGSRVENVSASGTTTSYCPSGYSRSGNTCVRNVSGYYMAKCPSGFNLNADGTCTGTVGTTTTFSPSCPNSTDYVRSGTTCYKVASGTVTATPTCPSGYTLNGSTCSKQVTSSSTSGKVVYSKGTYIATLTGYSVPSNNSSYYYETVSSDYVYKCIGSNPCAFVWIYTYKKYTTISTGGNTSTSTSTVTAAPSCPSGYTLSGSRCIKATTYTETTAAKCSSGSLVGDVCYSRGTTSKTVQASCPTGFSLSGNKCYGSQQKTVGLSTTTSYSCPSGYTLSGSMCTRTVAVYGTQNIYENVKYYRYKERSYISGDVSTKWSTSQNDTALINQGYSLTGNKKCS
ncbi:MAG TPA: hypothetical protein PLV83_02935 [Bacilli bacterium]|nr:hypothetical protein [Bacilli bacterium]